MSFRVPVLETFSWQKQVKDILAAPPANPSKGDRYIVADVPSGDWSTAGAAKKIAWYDGSEWKYDAASLGWFTLNEASGEFIYFDGTKWDKMYANQIKVDASQFSVQIPSTADMTLQELLVWMDANFGGPGPLGTPSDGSFADGLLEWNSQTRINDALDDTNEILLELAPAQANTLAGTTLANNRTLYSGKLPSGLDADTWYQDGKAAGDTVTNVINQSSVTLTSASPSDTFSKADEGFLIGRKRAGAGSLTQYAKINIGANFVEGVPGVSPRPSIQDLNAWKVAQKAGFECVDCDTPDVANTGLCVISKGNDKLVITDVRKYNNFNKWQKGNANMQFTSLEAGYHEFQMEHNVRSAARATAITKLFYDNNTDALTFQVSPTLVEVSTGKLRYLSGIPYYTDATGGNSGSGSGAAQLRVQFTGANVFKNIYRSDKIADYTVAGLSGTVSKAQATTPNVNDVFAVDDTFSINAANVYSLNSIVSATLYHPFKSNAAASSATENRYVNTYSLTRSTDTIEYFTDEQYRLPAGIDLSVAPAANGSTMKNQWDSTAVIANGNALVHNQQVKYPAGNYSTGILPAGGPNYAAGFTGDQVYLRAFNVGTAKNNFNLTLTNLVNADVGAKGAGNINVEIKLPGVSGWLDAGSAFMSGSFTGVDGNGCRTAQAGAVWTLTSGVLSTTASNGWVVVRITFRSSSAKSVNANMSLVAI